MEMMEMLPLTCRMQMGECGQGLFEACMEGTENMSCSDCSATFAEKGGCDMVMSGPSDDDDDFGAKMMEMLPLTCRMQMGGCGQGLYEACIEDMSCSDCSATFAENGGCEVMMSGLSADDMSAEMTEMMEMLPLTCRMQMGECGQGLFESCMEGTENMSCSDCSATFVEKGGCEMAMSGLSGDEFIDKIMEMLPNTCMWKMEECGDSEPYFEACANEGRIGRQHCESCAEKFAARGGCPLLNKEKDVDHLIPSGCHLCEMAATKYCKKHGGSMKKPSKGRQTKRKGKSGKSMKPKSGKRKSGKQSTGRTRRGKKSSKQGKKLRR